MKAAILVVMVAVLQASAVHVQNAIEKGVARAAAESPGDNTAATVSALTNVAVMLNERVAGRICIEIDPRLAGSTGVDAAASPACEHVHSGTLSNTSSAVFGSAVNVLLLS